MTTELIEIDAAALIQLLKNNSLTKQDLAQRLGISTKTVQRWINETVRRVRAETLGRIAHELGATPDQLRKSSVPLELRPINRVLEEICSETFVTRIRATDEYESYLRLLKSFNPQDLCSAQRLTLYFHIGQTTFFLGRIRASRLYLDEALKIAQALNDPNRIIAILTWAALREDFGGRRDEARQLIERCESYLHYTGEKSRPVSEYLFRKAHILYQSEHVEEAIPIIRESILIEYRNPAPTTFRLSMKYYHLSECYLRLKDFHKAQAALVKCLRMAERCGWVRGQAYCHFGFATIKMFTKADCPSVRASYNKAKLLCAHTSPDRINTRAEQREFIYLVIKGQLSEARAMIMNNIRLNRRFIYSLSGAILDGLFFSKVAPEVFTLRPSLIERAKDYFEKNNLQKSLQAVHTLQSKSKITIPELLELYVF